MNYQIPPYLGLGILDPLSVNVNYNETTAVYKQFGKPVCKLFVSDTRAMLEDYVDGSLNSITSDVSVSRVILRHYAEWNSTEDPRYQKVKERISALGRVYFEDPNTMASKKRLMTCSPAGRLILIRVPIPLIPHRFIDWIDESGVGPGFKFDPYITCIDKYRTKMRTLNLYYTTDEEEILMLEFTVPLAYVYDAAKLLFRKYILRYEGRFRLIIQDIISKQWDYWKIFYGNENQKFLTCYIELKNSNRNFVLFSQRGKNIYEIS